MSRYYGVTFELLTFACTQRIWEESLANLDRAREVAGCEISLLRGWRPSLPGSLRLNGARLCAALAARPHSFDFIHARTDYSAAVAGTLPGRQRPPVLWDCRGDSRAEILDGKTSGRRLARTRDAGSILGKQPKPPAGCTPCRRRHLRLGPAPRATCNQIKAGYTPDHCTKLCRRRSIFLLASIAEAGALQTLE